MLSRYFKWWEDTGTTLVAFTQRKYRHLAVVRRAQRINSAREAMSSVPETFTPTPPKVVESSAAAAPVNATGSMNTDTLYQMALQAERQRLSINKQTDAMNMAAQQNMIHAVHQQQTVSYLGRYYSTSCLPSIYVSAFSESTCPCAECKKPRVRT